MSQRRRISVQLDEDLYTQLRIFARGRNGQAPEVSAIVREALAQYLTPPARQTHVRRREQNVAPEDIQEARSQTNVS
jgi:metal-responsive CopG/Arc/MetJ family transcriptional regulator